MKAAKVDSSSDLAGCEEILVEELFNTAKEKGITVIEGPRPASFKNFLAKGKTGPVMTFFDDGCSDCVMREGVLGVQWEGVVIKKGPFDMGGVGA